MATCKLCNQDLVLELDPDDFDEATSSSAGGSNSSVPDDVQIIQCGCHFHWYVVHTIICFILSFNYLLFTLRIYCYTLEDFLFIFPNCRMCMTVH